MTEAVRAAVPHADKTNSAMRHPTVDTTHRAATRSRKETKDLIVDGLNITERVAEIEEQGFTIVENFITPEEVARIRHAFDTEVHITEMCAIGTRTGRTWRAHNLLAKTRAVDYLFLDPRIRALVEGVLGKYTQINVTTLFNVLPGETRQFLHQDDGLWPIKRPHPPFVRNRLQRADRPRRLRHRERRHPHRAVQPQVA